VIQPDILHSPEGAVTWHWHDRGWDGWGVFVAIELSGQAAYGISDAHHRYMESLTTFDPADGVPVAAQEAIRSHGGDPSMAFVVPCELRQ
jgi:hypothetical protein